MIKEYSEETSLYLFLGILALIGTLVLTYLTEPVKSNFAYNWDEYRGSTFEQDSNKEISKPSICDDIFTAI